MNWSVGPLSTAPRTSGETATTGAGVPAQRLADPRHREDRPDRDHRVRRADHDRPRAVQRVERVRRGARRRRAAHLDALHRPLRALADHELLEREPLAAGVDPRAQRVVGRRQHARGDAERRAQLVDRLGERRAGGEPAGAPQADGQVAIAEVEPDVLAELAQHLHDGERVPAQAPAALVDAVREPERDEVGVGRHVAAVDLDVVGGVRDHHQLGAHHVEHPARELGPAGAAGEDDYLSGHSSSGSPVRRTPAWVL